MQFYIFTNVTEKRNWNRNFFRLPNIITSVALWTFQIFYTFCSFLEFQVFPKIHQHRQSRFNYYVIVYCESQTNEEIVIVLKLFTRRIHIKDYICLEAHTVDLHFIHVFFRCVASRRFAVSFLHKERLPVFRERCAGNSYGGNFYEHMVQLRNKWRTDSQGRW